jgi:hypothetical protein
MISLMAVVTRGGGGFALKALALALVTWVVSSSMAPAYGGGPGGVGPGGPGYGTLGYGGPGLYPGFPGFGLSYHPGYGYGGSGLGVGAFGGYPYYGGPGYPHDEPRLRRFGKIAPFPYYGGPGYPCYGAPNFFQGVGPLVVDRPVAIEGGGRRDLGYAGDYGPFTGALPYPESFFAPYTAEAGATGSYGGAGPSDPSAAGGRAAPADGEGRPSASGAPGTGEVNGLPAPARGLGIVEGPVVDADGVRGVKVSDVSPGGAAERAGLRAGEVIRSINGYLTVQPGNLSWIIAHAAPDHVLTMSVRRAGDGKERTITAQLP